MPEETKRWAIVGGGLLGLTLALRLAQRGEAVTLFEAADHVGGLADSWRLGRYECDRYYHAIHPSDTHTLSLLSELGLKQEVEWSRTRTGFYAQRRLYSLSNTYEFLRFPPLGLWDKLRLGLNIFYASRIRNWKRLERITALRWLRRWSGKRSVEKIWLPLMRAKLGQNAEQVSAAFIWTTIRRMYGARGSALKKETFGALPGGVGRIAERLAQILVERGVVIHLCQPAKRIKETPRDVSIEFENGQRERFHQVIVTVPGQLAARICQGLSNEKMRALHDLSYQGLVCASLLLKKPLAGYYVTNIVDKQIPFTAVIEMSALIDRKHLGGYTLVYLPKYVPSEDSTFLLSDQDIQEQFLSGLCRMYPAVHPDDLLHFRVARDRHVSPILTLNYSQQQSPLREFNDSIHIVNATYILEGTHNMNETVRVATDAAARLLGRRTDISG